MMLQAGTARADITPAPGSLMACFPTGKERTPRRAEGAHDPLQARVLCLSDGRETVALCSMDVALLMDVDVERIRRAVGERVPALGGPRLTLAASHTHSAPETTYLFGNTPEDPYIQEMVRRVSEAVIRAHAAMRPARVSFGRADAPLSHNRRGRGRDGKPAMIFDYDPRSAPGPADSDVPALRIDDDAGNVLAVLYNFAAHALTIGPGTLQYTADFPGVAGARIEQRFPGAVALFLNGGVGNVHPRKSMRKDFAVTEEIGAALAQAVIPAVESARPVDGAPLRFLTETISFPNRMDPSRSVPVELSCLELGGVVLGIMPGEPFVEFQLRFKQALAPRPAFFIGCANASVGYIPTREAFDEGGYGADAYAGDKPGRSRTSLPPGAGETLLDKLLLLASLIRE